MQGYAVMFISHSKDKTFKRKDGTEYTQIVPSCSTAYNEIIKNMCDIEAYISLDNGERTMIIRSMDDTVECKSRFKYIEPVIKFGYNELVEALNNAIDKEASMTGNSYITTEREQVAETVEYDYTSLVEEFQALAGNLVQKDANVYGPKITQIVQKYLGRNKKVSESTPDQAELIYLIVQEMKDIT